jgi:RNA polymerase primary sigma factor
VATANTFRRFLIISGLSVDDLVGWGWPGLRRAVLAFDVSRGLRFSTYAIWWIKHAMRRAMQDHGRTIRIPVHAQERARDVTRAVADLVNDGFTHDEAVEVMRVADPLGYTKWLCLAPPVSADAPVFAWKTDGEQMGTIRDLLADDMGEAADEALGRREALARVDALMSGLDDRRAPEVLAARFGLDGEEPRNLTQIGVTLGISRERVRQLEQAAMAQLQFHARREGLVDGVVRRPLSARQASLHTHRVPAGEQVALAL